MLALVLVLATYPYGWMILCRLAKIPVLYEVFVVRMRSSTGDSSLHRRTDELRQIDTKDPENHFSLLINMSTVYPYDAQV